MATSEDIINEQSLISHRVHAAELSAGTSGDPIYRAVYQQVQNVGASGQILDYGAGTGHFSRLLCDLPQFSWVTATDLFGYEAHMEHPKLEWVFCDLNQGIPGHDQEYDVVAALEIIEHLENPRFVAREWMRLLKPGGVLIFSTPNNESWRAITSLIFKHHFASFTGSSYPAHITALLRTDFERILTEAGFEQVKTFFTDDGLVPKFSRLKWQKLSLGAFKGLRWSDNVICVARKPNKA